jgi:hypothetical protein
MFKSHQIKKPKLIKEILQTIISYLSPFEFTDFFEQFLIPFDFKFKYDMSYYCININYLLHEEAPQNNNIYYCQYKIILKKFKNMIVTGIKLKFNLQSIFDQKFVTNIRLKNIHNIKHIDLCGINFFCSVINVSILENFDNLETLSIKHFELQSESNICKINCVKMHTLTILHCRKSTPFQFIFIGDLTRLKNVEFEEDFYNNFPLEKCSNLLKLNYYFNNNRSEYIYKYEKLQCLVLNNLFTVNLLNIDKLKNIKSITLNMCDLILNINCLSKCPNLKEICFKDNVDPINFEFLKNNTKLESLIIDNDLLSNIDFLENCHNLKKLEIYRCYNLQNINMLQNCHNIEDISIVECPDVLSYNLINKKLKHVKLALNYILGPQIFNMEHYEQLETLNIFYSDIKNFDFLNKCTKLKMLQIDNCHNIKYLNICNLTECTNLTITNCNELTHIYANKILYNLQTVYISYCYKLAEINVLKNCINLRELYLHYNYSLIYVDDLRNCKKLNYIYLRGPYIKNIEILRLYKRSNFMLNMIIDNYYPYNCMDKLQYNYNLSCYYARLYILENKGNIHHGILKNILKKFLYEVYND